MSKVIVQQRVTPMGLYESNFDRLMVLIPNLPAGERDFLAERQEGAEVRVQVLERSRYTLTVLIRQFLGEDGRLVPDPYMKVRVYLDARAAEVVAYQGHHRFRPRYAYPNRRMFQPSEKRRVNEFLGEWLSYCIARGYRFAPVGDETRP